MRIWKYPLAVIDTQLISMPRGAKALSVQVQDGTVCLWALVEAAPKEEVRINIVGTGNPIPNNVWLGSHIDTFQLLGGNLVFHAFIAPA